MDSLKHNVGNSDYSKRSIQPWEIWEAYPELNPWEADIVKRILRNKKGETRIMDYKKIKHITEYLIEMLILLLSIGMIIIGLVEIFN